MAAWGAAAAASLATAPLIAGIGGGVPLLSVPANLLAAPAVGPASVLGLSAAVVGVVAPAPGEWLTVLAAVPAGWIAGVARRAQDLPGAVLPWPEGVTGALTLTAVLGLGAGGLLLARRAGRARPVVATAAAVAVLVVLTPTTGIPLPGSGWPPPGWVLVACDVGQGDGLVLNAGPGAAVVVDTGPDPKVMDRCLTRLGVRAVPVLVLSHEHADHVEGVPGVLRGGRSVGQILVSPLVDPPTETSRVQRWAQDAGVPLRQASAGEQQVVGTVTWTVLWPDRLLHGTDSDPNNASLVLLVRAAGITLLLGGDVEPEAQRVLLRDHPAGHVDVVKVPHHGSAKQSPGWAPRPGRGSRSSSGPRQRLRPPAPATVAAYRAVGALVGSTDLDGDLAVVLDDAGRPASPPAARVRQGACAGLAGGPWHARTPWHVPEAPRAQASRSTSPGAVRRGASGR